MKLPAESSSSWTHIIFGTFTWSSFKAWSIFPALLEADRKMLADGATTLRGSIDTLLKEARETQDQLLFGRPEAQANQNARLIGLKRAFSGALALVIAKLGNGSKDHPTVREFLPDLLTGLTRTPVAERPEAATNAALRLDNNEGTFEGKDALVVQLKNAAGDAQAAIEANEASWSAWGKERSEEIVAKGRLRIELERAHRALGAQFPKQRDFVESFFLRAGKPSEGALEEEEPATDGTP
jgi:hypothetical protein